MRHDTTHARGKRARRYGGCATTTVCGSSRSLARVSSAVYLFFPLPAAPFPLFIFLSVVRARSSGHSVHSFIPHTRSLLRLFLSFSLALSPSSILSLFLTHLVTFPEKTIAGLARAVVARTSALGNRGYDRYCLRAFRPHNSCNSRHGKRGRGVRGGTWRRTWTLTTTTKVVATMTTTTTITPTMTMTTSA